MNDDTAPAWAGALLAAINDLRAEMQKTDTRLDRIADQLNQTADEIEQANATLDRIIAATTGRAPDGRGD